MTLSLKQVFFIHIGNATKFNASHDNEIQVGLKTRHPLEQAPSLLSELNAFIKNCMRESLSSGDKWFTSICDKAGSGMRFLQPFSPVFLSSPICEAMGKLELGGFGANCEGIDKLCRRDSF